MKWAYSVRTRVLVDEGESWGAHTESFMCAMICVEYFCTSHNNPMGRGCLFYK